MRLQSAKRERKGYVVTGGQDAIVNIFSLASLRDDPNFSLLGHTANVCALDTSPDGTIISGSWDQYVLYPQIVSYTLTGIILEQRESGKAFSSRMSWWDIHNQFGLSLRLSQTNS